MSSVYGTLWGYKEAGFTTNPDAAGHACGDKIDYANRVFSINGGVNSACDISMDKNGCFSNSYTYGEITRSNGKMKELKKLRLLFNFYPSEMLVSIYETRVKSIFFSLMIYAGYPA